MGPPSKHSSATPVRIMWLIRTLPVTNTLHQSWYQFSFHGYRILDTGHWDRDSSLWSTIVTWSSWFGRNVFSQHTTSSNDTWGQLREKASNEANWQLWPCLCLCVCVADLAANGVDDMPTITKGTNTNHNNLANNEASNGAPAVSCHSNNV